MNIRWPFSWRSTVEAWESLFMQTHGQLAKSYERNGDLYDRCSELQKRLVALTDLDRTTPAAMANVFAEWDAERQAEFLNLVGELTSKWERARCFQFAYITDELNENGSRLLEELAEYARPEASK